MEAFLGWVLESSLLIVMILGIRKVFMGKIRYSLICALWMIVFLRFLIPVNFISTPFSVGNAVTKVTSVWKLIDKNGRSAQSSDNMGENAGQSGAGDTYGVSNLHFVGVASGKQPSAEALDENVDKALSEQGGVGALLIAMKGIATSVNWRFAAKCIWVIISIFLFVGLCLRWY